MYSESFVQQLWLKGQPQGLATTLTSLPLKACIAFNDLANE